MNQYETMSGVANPFSSEVHDEFCWPVDRPLVAVPSPPPRSVKRRLHMTRIDPDQCDCDVHNVESSLKKYKELSKKEKDLCHQITHVNDQLTTLVSDMLSNPMTSDDDVMKSIYQVAYNKNRNIQYRPLMAALDAPVRSPITPVISHLQSGYRDPISFRYSPVEIPAISPAEPVDFSREPESFTAWWKPFTGRSEYMDTYSKMGLSNMKNQQQYLEPLPSSRRRWGDCKL